MCSFALPRSARRRWLWTSVSPMMMNIPEGNLFHINFHARFCQEIWAAYDCTYAQLFGDCRMCVVLWETIYASTPSASLCWICLTAFRICSRRLWFRSSQLKHGKIIYFHVTSSRWESSTSGFSEKGSVWRLLSNFLLDFIKSLYRKFT